MSYSAALDRFRHWRRFGRWLALLPALGAGACLLVLGCGLADAWWVFEAPARTALVVVALVALTLAALAALIVASRVSRARAAAVADRTLGSPRRPAAAALGLPENEAATPLGHYLTGRAREAAAAELRALPPARIIAWQPVGRAVVALLLAAAPLAVLALVRPEASQTIARRLLHPAADLPPWSPLRFALDPPRPAAVYGGELALAVEVSGATPQAPVELLVRRDASRELLRLPSFRESPVRFSRTLDSITEPVSVAFACGKARSAWLPVELLLQPKVLAGKVTITPPAHVASGPLSAPLDRNELAALEGAQVVLELTSNRPLAPSSLVLTPAPVPGAEASPTEIPGEITAADAIAFRWTVTRSGKLSAVLRDVRGTAAAAPLVLALRAMPDQAPVVDLSSPPRTLLATPSATLQLVGRAEDDHALSKVQFVRTLEGFRDRARVVAPALRERDFEFRDRIELAALGVAPGQVLEMYLEASDHNPSLLGQGASEISRVQIISEDDYAARLRARTTLQQFSARFAAVAQALQRAREALETMDRAAAADDQPARDAARAQATEAHRQAAELLERLAADFPAFELEKRLKDLAAKSADDARQNLAELAAFNPSQPAAEQHEAIRRMLGRLGARQAEHDQLQQDAALLAEAGKLLEMAAKFQQIYANQVSVTKRLLAIAEEIRKGNDQNRRLLPSLGETQQKIRESLDAFAIELKARAEGVVNPLLAPLRDSALAFLEELALANPQSAMDGSARAATDGMASDAFTQAELARAQLERLMSRQDSPFAEACNGRCMKFPVAPPDLNATMQQMLEGLLCQNPGMSPGPGFGAGGFGTAGSGPTGSSQSGYSMMDIPVVGPERMSFEPAGVAGAGNSSGRPGKGRPGADELESGTLPAGEGRLPTATAPDPEAIPEPYREAVKRYFDPES